MPETGTPALSDTAGAPATELDEPVIPLFDAARAGLWRGTTSQNRPIEFAVAEDGTLLGLQVEMRMTLAGGTCTGPLRAAGSQQLEGDEFETPISVPLGGVATTLRGRFEGDRLASGTYDGHSGSFFLVCGGTVNFGTGSLFAAGTWSATPCPACSLACPFVGDGTCDEPSAGGTGLCYLGTDSRDCCSAPRNGICEHASGGGACVDGRDFYDCGECPFVEDGECDEGASGICPSGTDVVDCTPAVCGNGVVERDEDCDGGPACDATCNVRPACSDGVDGGTCPPSVPTSLGEQCADVGCPEEVPLPDGACVSGGSVWFQSDACGGDMCTGAVDAVKRCASPCVTDVDCVTALAPMRCAPVGCPFGAPPEVALTGQCIPVDMPGCE